MKKDHFDIMLEQYESRLKDVLEYYNVQQLEDKGIAKQYWGMVKDELRVLHFFLSDVYLKSSREQILKKRHKDKYWNITQIEKTLEKCLDIHGIAKSLVA